MIKNIISRIKMDYFTEDRLYIYSDLLRYAIDNGYILITLRDFWLNKAVYKDKKVMILRHDIDTALPRARDFFNVEKKLGAIGSYYFRLKMLDVPLMQEIEKFGGEASYHFEEIATYSKLHKIRDAKTVYKEIGKIQQDFLTNYNMIKNLTGLQLLTIASHGDFVNVKLRVTNYELLSKNIRQKCGIIIEAYDHEFKDRFLYISDVATPLKIWDQQILLEAIESNVAHLYFLTHPRQWGSSCYHNTKANFIRVYEGIKYFL